MSHTSEEVREEPKSIPLSEFLESTPPGRMTRISVFSKPRKGRDAVIYGHTFNPPELQLFCGSDTCNRVLFFRPLNFESFDVPTNWKLFFLDYRCANCQKGDKKFALAIQLHALDSDGSLGECYKFGELPEFGPSTPSQLMKLIAPDRELFLKGRRCENQGMGVAAFAYYRRVVETQKNRILDEVIRVATGLKTAPEMIAILEGAKNETQFSKALESAKDAIPQALLVDGHNPLTLLHSALSEGLHAQTDEECLDSASAIRVVLAEFSERMSQALKDEAELKRALGRLMNKNKPAK